MNSIRFVVLLSYMVVISLLLLVGSLVYLLVGLYTQNELREEQAVDLELLREEMNDAEREFEEISEPIFDRIAGVYGDATAANVRNGDVDAGFPEELLLLAWGEPESIESAYVKGANTEKWYYDPQPGAGTAAGYKTEVTITNGIISEIRTDE